MRIARNGSRASCDITNTSARFEMVEGSVGVGKGATEETKMGEEKKGNGLRKNLATNYHAKSRHPALADTCNTDTVLDYENPLIGALDSLSLVFQRKASGVSLEFHRQCWWCSANT